MIKVLMLILIYNLNTGEITSVYEQAGRLPGFETRAACEQVIKNDLHRLKVPGGYGLYATCIEPNTTTT